MDIYFGHRSSQRNDFICALFVASDSYAWNRNDYGGRLTGIAGDDLFDWFMSCLNGSLNY